MQGNFLDEEHLHTGCFFHAKSGRETIQRSNVNESAMFEEEKKDNIFLTAKTPIRGSLEWVVWVSHRHLANNPVDEWSHLWRPQCRAWQSKGVCLKKWTISKKKSKFEATTGSSLELLNVLPGLFEAMEFRSLPAVYISSLPCKMPW